MTSTARSCKARTKRGDPCGAYALPHSDFCFHHDPTRAQERRDARQKGGRARHGRKIQVTADVHSVTLHEVGDVLPLLSQAIKDVLLLENSVARARTIGYLAGVAIKALELSELEQRVAVLEKTLEEGRAAA